MENRQSLRDVERLRMALQTNNRLNLEFRGSLSKILRDHGQQVDDYLLRELVVALPAELPGVWMGGVRPYVEPLSAATSSKKSKKSDGSNGITPQKRGRKGSGQKGQPIPPQERRRRDRGQKGQPIPPQKAAKKAAKKSASKKGGSKKGASKKA
ncbi:MAG: hypothetical protein LC800_00185 [Acidobacteria bacterium]|nr:hypothetical protein [Acidobacteriota bacterium]